jgi:hypothetical protein
MPPLSYVLDHNAQALRPIWGFPGAARIGEPLDAGLAIRDVVVDGAGAYALAITTAKEAYVIGLQGIVSASQVTLSGPAEALYTSPRHTAAAVWTKDGVLNFLSGLADGMVAATAVPLDKQPSAAAVSDDGRVALAAFTGSAQLWLLGADGSRIPIQAPGPVTVLAFRPSSYDALAAGPDNRVWLLRETVANPAFTPVAGPDDGIAGPAAVAFLPDGIRVAIANFANRTITLADLSAGAISTVSCDCAPERIERLAGTSWFRLNGLSSRPMFVLDARAEQVRFIPPPAANVPSMEGAQ